MLPEIIFGLIQATPEREVTMKLQSLDTSVITSVSVEKVSLTCDEAVQKKAQLPSLKQGIVQRYLKGISIKTDIDL